MVEIFSVALSQMLVLFIFMLLGYLLQRKKLAPPSTGKSLSSLLVNIFLPALNVKVFAANVTPAVLKEKSTLILASCVILGVTFLLSPHLAKLFAKSPRQREVYTYAFTIANYGYLGYPLVEAVFGEEALFSMMVFCIPYSVAVYTWGMYILNPNKELNIKKLLNPTTAAMVVGIVLGLTGLKLPPVLTNTLEMGSACMAPCAMILTGFVLAKNPLREVLAAPKMYLASLIRLILIPGAVGILLYLFHLRGELLMAAVMTLAMPMGLNNVVFPEAFGGDSITGAQSCIISNLLGLVTIPLMVSLLSLFL